MKPALPPRSKRPTYRAWEAMRARCTDPQHPNYASWGGRGIRVCERWRASYEAFAADMGERPAGRTLDRIDNNGNYEPGNCRWATPTEQARNRRDSLLITHQGQTKPLKQWCEELGLPYFTVLWRLKKGHSVDIAFQVKREGRKLTLTDAIRAEIRAQKGKATQMELRQRYGLGAGTVCTILKGAP